MWNVQVGDVTEIDLECTTFCNLACPECNRTLDEDNLSSILNTTHITLENCKTWFKPNELINLTDVRFCGAIDEALMNPELTDILDFFLDEFKIKYIDIRTNGAVRTPEFWTKLVNHLPPKHIIVFGLDGLEDTLHIYRVGADYKKVINNAKAFIDAGGIASWQFIEFEHNKHQIEEAKQLAIELGFKEFRLVSSTRPSMTENLEHIRKDGKVTVIPEKPKNSDKMVEQGPLNDNTSIQKKKPKIKEQSWAKMTEKDTKPPVQEITLVKKEKDTKPPVQEITLVKKEKKQVKLKSLIRCENQAHGRGISGNRILVNAYAQVTPCCFLNGYFHQPYGYKRNPVNVDRPGFNFHEANLEKLFLKHKDNQNDITAISLEHHTLKEILEGDFFADIQDSWSTKDPIERCLEVCGKDIRDDMEDELINLTGDADDIGLNKKVEAHGLEAWKEAYEKKTIR